MAEHTHKDALLPYVIQLGDNALINSHRMSEWCAKAPSLELDVAMANCGLDYVGQARSLFSYAAEIEARGRNEDHMAYLRDEHQYRNILLLEQPNTDWGYSIARMFFYSSFANLFYQALTHSKDATLAAIAEKSLKEVTYHQRFSAEWLIRLGDGTDESHQRIQQAVDSLWMYMGEMFSMSAAETELLQQGISIDLKRLRKPWGDRINDILGRATLTRPENGWMQSGGKQGRHSEHMGYILTDLQFMQRRHPDCSW